MKEIQKTETEAPLTKGASMVLLALAIGIYLLVTAGVVHLYKTAGLGELSLRMVQNGTYLVFLAMSLALMRCAKKPFAHFGVFFERLPVQLLVGAAAGIGLKVFILLFGSVPSIPQDFVYTALSQLLVGISEETFWRGFVVQMIWDISGTKDRAVLVSSLLFGLCHFPVGGSIAQVIVACLIGMLLAVLRTEFKDTLGIPALAVGHAITNIF